MKKISSMLDRVANSLESKGLIKEASELDSISNALDKFAGVGLSLMGSGEQIAVNGETKITNRERKGYQQALGTKQYYPSLSELTSSVVTALGTVGLTAVAPGQERWVGTFTGALSSGETAHLKEDLVLGDKEVINSKLILNIFKMDTNKIAYELNSYLS